MGTSPAIDGTPAPAFADGARVGLRHIRAAMLGFVRDSSMPDLTLRQLGTLMLACGAERAATVRCLAAEMGVSKAAVSRAFDRLERFGLAERQPDPRDGRGVLLVVTVRGWEMVRALGREMAVLDAWRDATSEQPPDSLV